MKYTSTRSNLHSCGGAEAIRSGLAPDGGLFVPETLPHFDLDEIRSTRSYAELAARILARLLTDYREDELAQCAKAVYGDNFDHAATAPLVPVGRKHVLELWHGPTSAFKDMALQIMPRLLTLALAKTDEASDVLILVATSGDTGKAALEGFRDIPRTSIQVFFPLEGVSEVQRRQMVTQEGANVDVVAVEGNFDDAQTGVKRIFSDTELRADLARQGLKLSSANSINWGRLAPQTAYYFSAYRSLCASGAVRPGDPVNFCVPTGNFGNILAGYYAKRMGLPVGRLICASNDNNVLTEFLKTGVYDRNRAFRQTISPSMDILISSNLERLLFHATGRDFTRVASWMAELETCGRYEVDRDTLQNIQSVFWAGWASEDEACRTIRQVWEQERYLLDPHSAVAWKVADAYETASPDGSPTIVLSTASPFKFADTVLQALGEEAATAGPEAMRLLRELAGRTGWEVPAGLLALDRKEIRHSTVCAVSAMSDAVRRFVSRPASGR